MFQKLGLVALGLGVLVACGSSEPEPPSEKADAKALCKAIGDCEDCDDAAQDQALAALTPGTEWGKSAVTELSAGGEIGPDARKMLVGKIKETQPGGLDCTLIEAVWSEL